MKLTEIIQDANKTGNIIIGYNKCKKFIKVNEARLVVVANNAPARIRNEMEHNARIAGINFEVFAGTSRELGVLCGKPYPASVLVIK